MTASMLVRRRRRGGWTLAAVGALLLLLVAGMPAAGADGVVVQGNTNCDVLIPTADELRVNNPTSGQFTDPDGTLVVDVTVRTLTADDPAHPGDQTGSQVFDFEVVSGGVVVGVAVKGGDDVNFYDYRPNGVFEGTGLHAPVVGSQNNDKFHGLSHISFCYDPVAPDLLRVLKVDEGGSFLAGAVFQLWQESGDVAGFDPTDTAIGEPCTTEADGVCEFEVDESGTYYIEETDPPPGFELPDEPVITVEVTLDASATTHEFVVVNGAITTTTTSTSTTTTTTASTTTSVLGTTVTAARGLPKTGAAASTRQALVGAGLVLMGVGFVLLGPFGRRQRLVP